jgi:hypothetical protein
LQSSSLKHLNAIIFVPHLASHINVSCPVHFTQILASLLFLQQIVEPNRIGFQINLDINDDLIMMEILSLLPFLQRLKSKLPTTLIILCHRIVKDGIFAP